METTEIARNWAEETRFSDRERECMKILDRSCKMDETRQTLFLAVYDGASAKGMDGVDPAVSALIRKVRSGEGSEAELAEVTRLRKGMMERIPKPEVKGLKQRVWEGLAEVGVR